MIKLVVKDGKPIFENDASITLYNRVMAAYSNTGKILVMTIEEWSPDVTDAQHKLFKALLVKGSEASGYTYKEFEDELIDNFAPYKFEKNIFDTISRTKKKVLEMNNKEFNLFIEQAIQFCNEFYGLNF
jgi:hypothetical protein